MCVPMEAVQSLADDTDAVATRLKVASEHGLHSVKSEYYRTECGPFAHTEVSVSSLLH